MKNNATLIDEIFSSIDEMDSITMESSLEVMNSILDSYDKALTIMENYEGDDIDAFSMIYQEGEIMDEVRAKSKDSNMFVNIIAFIPRLLIAISMQFRKHGMAVNLPKMRQLLQRNSKHGPQMPKIFFRKLLISK